MTPKTANISISINGVDYTIGHKNFSSLSMKRTVSDVCNSFTLNILDNASFDIEAALLSGNNDITIKYIDDNKNIYKTLTGSILQIRNSFVDNRNMLTLEGYASVNVQQKYRTQSMNWNKVPKFDWEDISKTLFSEYTKSLEDGVSVEDIQKQIDEDYEAALANYTRLETWENQNKPVTKNSAFSDFAEEHSYGMTANAKRKTATLDSQRTAPELLANLFLADDGIMIDEDGNYYLNPGYFYSDSVENGGSNTYEPVASSGTITVPMKPGKIMQLIFFGGKYENLLSTNIKDYKGTSIYSGDSSINVLDWYFIKLWYKRLGTRSPINTEYVDISSSNWGKTDYVTDDLTQTKQSYYNYIYDTLLTKCVYTTSKGVLSNYYVKIDGNNVSLERVDASKSTSTSSKATYVYYGAFEKADNQGILTSFSAKLNVLTSMITNGTNTSDDGDISQVNLITGSNNEATLVEEDSDSTIPETLYTPVWGAINYSITSTNSESSFTNIVDIFTKARNQCYTATATITGFNTLSPLDFIDIVIVPKTTNTGAQLLHHTSGKYYIQSIEDKIENGEYTSSLSLIKNIQSQGNTKVTFDTSSVAWHSSSDDDN